jgi:hypothetical protein
MDEIDEIPLVGQFDPAANASVLVWHSRLRY